MIERKTVNARMSQIVSYPLSGRMVLFSGQVPDNKDGDMGAQTASVLAKIDRLLAEAGATRADIVAAWNWVTDMAAFNEMNAVWDAWVPTGAAPVRACVQAELADPAFKVEIQVQAVLAA